MVDNLNIKISLKNKSVSSAFSLFLASAFLAVPSVHAHENEISVTVKNSQRCFSTNGIPDHKTGTFPNRYNPNAVKPQNINMCVTTNPVKGASAKPHTGAIGIGINGVQFRPGTAGYYDGSDRRGHSRDPASGWKLEGINPGNILGMDSNNAHVGRNGLYHYHGVANSLVKSSGNGPIGFAADGFEIHYAGSTQKSSYQLKSGTRPSGPGGAYDGTYEEDWKYVAGAGTLDKCNGGTLNGKFVYFATEAYPYLPRCLWGNVSKDFVGGEHAEERRASPATNKKRKRAGNEARARQNQRNENQSRRRPSKNAIRACRPKQEGDSCSFKRPNRNRTIDGICKNTRSGAKACVPLNR